MERGDVIPRRGGDTTQNDKNECCSGDEGNGSKSRSLPDYYPSVVKDILRWCRPREGGCWADLGSGRRPVGKVVADRCRAHILLVDPSDEALGSARESAAVRGLGDRIKTLCGHARVGRL